MNAHDEALDYLLCSVGATAVDVLAAALKAARAAVKARVRDLDYDSYLEALRYARSRAEMVNPRWMVSAEDSVSARLPKAWVSFKSMGKTITGCRDVRIPAPRYWPGGSIPDGAEVATPGVYGAVPGAAVLDPAELIGDVHKLGANFRYDPAEQVAALRGMISGAVISWKAAKRAHKAQPMYSREKYVTDARATAVRLAMALRSVHRATYGEKTQLAESVREMA